VHIFVDSSVSHQMNLSIGSYLIIPELANFDKRNIRNVQFTCSSSTEAELLAARYVLKNIDKNMAANNRLPNVDQPIYLYTDCTNIVGLTDRMSKKDIHRHNYGNIYKELSYLINKLNVNVIHVKGHSKQQDKILIHDRIFTFIDRDARKTLRNAVKNVKIEIGI